MNEQQFYHYVNQITQVVPLPEAARCWDKNRKTVEMAIARKRVIGLQCGTTWLLSRASLVSLWGEPTYEPEYK